MTENIKDSAKKKDQSVIKEDEKKENKAAREEREYWIRKANTFPEKKRTQWTMLDKWLQNYYVLVKDRQDLVEETGKLHMQNEELKTLLNQ